MILILERTSWVDLIKKCFRLHTSTSICIVGMYTLCTKLSTSFHGCNSSTHYYFTFSVTYDFNIAITQYIWWNCVCFIARAAVSINQTLGVWWWHVDGKRHNLLMIFACYSHKCYIILEWIRAEVSLENFIYATNLWDIRKVTASDFCVNCFILNVWRFPWRINKDE